MNKLKIVTISGVDDKVNIDDLLALQADFPFVEWAVLASPKQGRPRYPRFDWIQSFTRESALRKSLHLCGDYARGFARNLGDNYHNEAGERGVDHYDVISRHIDLEAFNRIQINVNDGIDLNHLVYNISRCPIDSVIMQLSGVDDYFNVTSPLNTMLIAAQATQRVYPFFDASRGTGKEETKWQHNIPFVPMRGFAGAIGPKNVESVILSILSGLSNEHRFWIDMESRVRNDKEELDLNLVKDVLIACKRFFLAN